MNIGDVIRDMAKNGKTEETIRFNCRGMATNGAIDVALHSARKAGLLSRLNREVLFRDDARRASILHLVDLKRAGHSPTRTEYRISSDSDVATAYQRTPRVLCSYLGSPAAMCSDQGPGGFIP